MADKKQTPTQKAAPDPTVFSGRGRGPEYPEGSHPPVDPADATWGPGRFSYSDLEEALKPSRLSVVQQVESDPVRDSNEKAIREDLLAGQKVRQDDQK
jgi:hypothetical protein